MLVVDDRRRFVDANRPARLAFRLSLAEMRTYTIEDLTPEYELETMEQAWAELMGSGCATGPYEVAIPDGDALDVVYHGLAGALPGVQVIAFAPAAWPEDELGALEGGSEAQLTPRELELLQLAADGSSGPDIADRLVLSHATVRTHFRNIYDKLGVSDRAAAVAKTMRLGLID